MLVYLANNCSDYHGGSAAVIEVIRTRAEAVGHKLVPETNRTDIEYESLTNCDAVVVNGEGTMHHSKPRSLHLLRLLEAAQKLGKYTALINTSWMQMTHEYDDVLRRLDLLVAREPYSAECLIERHGAMASLFPDLSLQHPAKGQQCDRSDGIMVTDFYSKEFDCFVAVNGGPFFGARLLDLRHLTWQETLDAVSGCRVLVTGRFHGLMAALRTSTPFIVYPGNSHKLQGMLAWLGAGELGIHTFSELPRAARSWRRHMRHYKSSFEWSRHIPSWRFPF